jgi:hypothetical protein
VVVEADGRSERQLAPGICQFGDREVMTPEMDEQGEPVFRKVVDKIVLSHTVRSETYNGRGYKSAKLDVWFRRTRGSLLPAVPIA